MSVRDTSILAYEEVLPKIGQKQANVLDAISVAKRPVNDQEIAAYLMVPINTITNRRGELVKMGKIELAFKDIFPVTNRKVCYWKLKDESQ